MGQARIKAIAIAKRMVAAREELRARLGAEYERELTPWRAMVAKVAKKARCVLVRVPLELDPNCSAIEMSFVLAATLDEIEAPRAAAATS